MKLALGTVQFGIKYGAFNNSGKVPLTEVAAILERAREAGVTILDTARGYGDAEGVLAQAAAPQRFDIVTKCPDIANANDPAAAVHEFFDVSCAALGVSNVYGYLLHNSDDLARPGVWDVLETLVSDGRVERVGVSGYDVAQVAALCERFPITLTQLPANVLAPWFMAPQLPKSVELHVRSAFLQGFLLANSDQLPAHLAPWRATLVDFRAQSEALGLTPLQAALAPLLACPHIARVVVGVENLTQFDEILTAATIAEQRDDIRFTPFPGVSDDLTDPRRWKPTP